MAINHASATTGGVVHQLHDARFCFEIQSMTEEAQNVPLVPPAALLVTGRVGADGIRLASLAFPSRRTA